MSARSGLRNTLDFSGDAVYMEEVYSELGGSIIVEHCKDCARHASTTRHDERKYKQYFDALEQLVGRCFPNCEIEANPPAVLKRITGSKAPRLGSFEVYVANEDGSNKQVVFSKSLTNKWPNLPTIGRYIMNVIEPDKIPEPSFDEEGNETLGSGKMPTAPFIYNHPPHDFRNPVIQERKWGYGNMNNTTHAGHHEVTHIYPKGPEEPQSTYKDKIWRDYNTMQRTAKPRQPAPSTPPQVNEFVQYNTVYGDGDAFDQAADEVFLDPVVEGQPGADVPEESHEALVEGFLPPIPDAEPRPMGGEEEKVVEGREAEALPEAEAPVVLPEDEDRAEEEKGASEEVPAEGGEEAMGVGEEILAEGGVGPHAAEEAEGGAEAAVEDEPPVEAVEEKTREEAEAMAEKKPAEEATVADDEEEEPADTASHGA